MSERSRTTPDAPVAVVGGGMAGLTCALSLHAAGVPVRVLEASDGLGGRVRTDRHPEGFLLDRGFQVILEAYPALQRQVDIAALRPGRFDAGALIWTGRRLVPVADPLRHPSAIARDITTNLFPFADKLRLAAFAFHAKSAPWESAREATGDRDQSAAQALWSAGFSNAFVDRFARPFWGGITLDRTLGLSQGPLLFTLKMFLDGAALLPEGGVQAVPDQLAARLPEGVVQLGRRVDRIVIEDGTATGVVAGGETIPARAVVVAADPPAARALTGIEAIPAEGVGCVTVFLRGRRNPGAGKRLVLDGTGRRAVNHIAPLSSVAPSYAPPGEHLVAAVMLGDSPLGGPFDDRIAQKARDDVAAMLGHAPSDWAALEVVPVPFAQFRQPPGIHQSLPRNRTDTPGLYLASEATVDSSLNGAMTSGEQAARAILDDLRRR